MGGTSGTEALEAGDAGGAEDLSREAILECQRDERISEEARATAVLALALLAGERSEEGREAAEEALRLAESSEQPAVLHAAGIAAARAQAAAGDPDGALMELGRIEDLSGAAGYLAWSLEARLAWAEAALAAGREDEARQRLRTLVTDAGTHGLARLVDKAGKL